VSSRVAAVVVDYDTGPVLADCVRSLLAEGIPELVVVENGDAGMAHSVMSADDLSSVPVIVTGRNIGYGAGANRGTAATPESDYILICNPDLAVHRGSVDALVNALDEEPKWALVGPRVLTPEGASYPSVRCFPSIVDGAGHALFGMFWPENRFTKRYRTPPSLGEENGHEKIEADWVSGSCFMARRSAFEELGGFDESYFMFAEDMDLCWRAHRAGWGVGFEPKSEVTHLGGVSRKHHPYRMELAHHTSAFRFVTRTTTGWRRLLIPFSGAVLVVRLMMSWAREAAGISG